MSEGAIVDAAGALVLGSLLWVPYALGARTARREGSPEPTAAARCAYATGAIVVVGALWPLVDEAAAARFSWHMVQHLLLLVVAAPLLAAGRPELGWGPLVPERWQVKIPVLTPVRARWLLVVALLGSTALVWGWHLPEPFDAALRSEPVHALEHLGLLAAGVLFWWPILSPGVRRSAGEGAVLLALVAGGLQSSALGALMVFASSAWYPAYRGVELAHGVRPLADQQVAGSLMWIPPSLVQLGVAAWLFLGWLSREELADPVSSDVRLSTRRAGYRALPGRTSR